MCNTDFKIDGSTHVWGGQPDDPECDFFKLYYRNKNTQRWNYYRQLAATWDYLHGSPEGPVHLREIEHVRLRDSTIQM